VKNRGEKKSENNLVKKVLHSNWESKNTKFDNLEKEIKNKGMILKK
jgi:hypothetical protein